MWSRKTGLRYIGCGTKEKCEISAKNVKIFLTGCKIFKKFKNALDILKIVLIA